MKPAPLILIVDDASDNREAFAEYLQLRGFRTAQAGNGQQALEEYDRSVPDVVLLDMCLPDVPGVEVSRRIRLMKRGTTIIAVSACAFEQDVAAAMASGCDAFLAKPCWPDTVVGEIRRRLA